jgi:glycosyltransferase involved in cell wall biosynthesis
MISGFMIVKDLLKQGYPFVEAVASSLPICDEFLISDGYSTDGTFEIVQKMAKLNKKIKVFRQEWPAARRYTVLGEVTNAIRRKCKFEYMLSIQANEIIHEDSVDFIKGLPQMCPKVNTFSFPFWHFLHEYKFYEDFRLRFAKDLSGIVATGDAWSLGLSKAFVRSEAFRSARNPRKLLRFVGRGIEWTYANVCANPISRAMYLPKPIFRYWAISPGNFIEKSVRHAEMFGLTEHYTAVETLRNHVEYPASFWKLAAEMIGAGFDFNYPHALRVVDKKEHPRLIQDLLSGSPEKYYVRENILDSVRNL